MYMYAARNLDPPERNTRRTPPRSTGRSFSSALVSFAPDSFVVFSWEPACRFFRLATRLAGFQCADPD